MKEIPLSKGMIAIVDDEDYDYINQWSWNYSPSRHRRTGYAVRGMTVDGKYKNIKMHREVLRPADNMEVDHVDGNGLDNRRANLREATRSQNQQSKGKPRNNTTGYKGIYYSENKGKWRAQIGYGGKGHKLGWYKTIEGAAKAYNRAAIKYHKEFAVLNEII
jgi:hypothetical protein